MKFKFEILNNANFLKLWGSQLISQTALHSIIFSSIITAYSLTSQNKSVALVIMSTGLAAFLFGVPAGVLSDHLNRKSTLFWTSVLRFLVGIVLALIGGNLIGLLLMVFLLNAVTQFFFPSEAASIPALVKRNDLVSANSMFSITYYTAQIIGYLLSGLLLASLGYSGTVGLVSLFFLLSAIFIRNIHYPDNADNLKSNRKRAKEWAFYVKKDFTKAINTIKEEILKGFILVKSNSFVKRSFLYLVGLQIIIATVASLIPGFAVEVLSVSAEKASLFLVLPMAIGLLIGAVLLSKYKDIINKHLVIQVAIFIAFFSFMINGFSVYLDSFLNINTIRTMVLFVMVAIGLANSSVFVISNTTLQENVGNRLLGRIYGLLQTMVTILGVFPVFFGSFFADLIGIHYVFIAIGFVVLILHIFISVLVNNGEV